ncbi:MAG: hypothetical protein QNL62_13900 [Gammaproteobacteria bacterium]|nr:hypothetical protein [Gammaproteobacteria bacterium]
MELVLLATIARMMERSLIVIGGITAIYLGYKLFVLGIGSTQGEASAFGIQLKNFGPGLFFAALGAVILVTTMRASIKVGPAEEVRNESFSHEIADQNTKSTDSSNAVFFGMEDVARKNNKWTNISFYLDTRQLLRRLKSKEPIESLSDLSDSLLSKLDSITMTATEYSRYQELTNKIPLSQVEQSELMKLEEKLFPYDTGGQ